MSRFDKLEKDLMDNQKEISTLQTFRPTKQVKQFLRQLFAEQSFLRREITKLTANKETKERLRLQRIEKANKNRSEKMKRTYRYFKAIKKHYPLDISLKELRSAFTRHKKGLETDISDVIWRNPSP
jgi:hypothetical protein